MQVDPLADASTSLQLRMNRSVLLPLTCGVWCRIINPPTQEKRYWLQSPPFLSMLDLVSAKYVSSGRAPGKSIQCQNTSGLCVGDVLLLEK